jgi:membrane protease YdiL (CAAX protease family)
LPAVLLATWIAIRPTRMSFTDYLALRWTSWRNFFIGVAALAILVGGWDLLSRALGREVTPGFMGDVLKSAQADGALWLLVIAFCVAAPMWEEIFARGFLYRGWSESSSASPARSSCRRWPGPRCICSTTGFSSARCFRSACCWAICVTAPTRPG